MARDWADSSWSGADSSWPGSETAKKKSWVATDTDTPDKTIKCKDCAADFVFEGWEQDWYGQRGWDLATKLRCTECVKTRKAAQAAAKDAGRRSCFNCGKGGHTSKECTEAKVKKPKRKSEDAEATGAKEVKKTNRPCYAFQRGECKRGDKCMFLHDAQPCLPCVPAASVASEQPPKKAKKLPKVSAHPFAL
jgi:hypothetical protein